MTTTVPGHGTATNSYRTSDDLVASLEKLVTTHVRLDTSAARDSASPKGTTYLRQGLILGKVTASGLYSHYADGASDGTQLENNCVILAQDVDLGSVTGDVFDVLVIEEGIIWSDALKGDRANWLDDKTTERYIIRTRNHT